MAHLEGYVSHIRFHNEENGYTVMEIETTHGDEVLVGNFHYINEGEYICAEGEYVDHPAHGPQYRMTSYTVKEPEDKAAMEREQLKAKTALKHKVAGQTKAQK